MPKLLGYRTVLPTSSFGTFRCRLFCWNPHSRCSSCALRNSTDTHHYQDVLRNNVGLIWDVYHTLTHAKGWCHGRNSLSQGSTQASEQSRDRHHHQDGLHAQRIARFWTHDKEDGEQPACSPNHVVKCRLISRYETGQCRWVRWSSRRYSAHHQKKTLEQQQHTHYEHCQNHERDPTLSTPTHHTLTTPQTNRTICHSRRHETITLVRSLSLGLVGWTPAGASRPLRFFSRVSAISLLHTVLSVTPAVLWRFSASFETSHALQKSHGHPDRRLQTANLYFLFLTLAVPFHCLCLTTPVAFGTGPSQSMPVWSK